MTPERYLCILENRTKTPCSGEAKPRPEHGMILCEAHITVLETKAPAASTEPSENYINTPKEEENKNE
jgi:hypothetical protein